MGVDIEVDHFEGVGLLPVHTASNKMTLHRTARSRSTAECVDQPPDDAADKSSALVKAPIVFLDIDDVICMSDPYSGSSAIAAVRRQRADAEVVYKHLFHAPAVDVLRQLDEQLGAEVRYVITSTWREHLTRSEMAEVLRRCGLAFVANRLEPNDRWSTPAWPERTRLHEIADWLRRHGAGEPFVVIDDDYSGKALIRARDEGRGPFQGRIVLCQERVGLLPEHLAALLDALRTPSAIGAAAPRGDEG